VFKLKADISLQEQKERIIEQNTLQRKEFCELVDTLKVTERNWIKNLNLVIKLKAWLFGKPIADNGHANNSNKLAISGIVFDVISSDLTFKLGFAFIKGYQKKAKQDQSYEVGSK